LRCLFRLSGDGLYAALSKMYREGVGEIVTFKQNLHDKLENYYQE